MVSAVWDNDRWSCNRVIIFISKQVLVVAFNTILVTIVTLKLLLTHQQGRLSAIASALMYLHFAIVFVTAVCLQLYLLLEDRIGVLLPVAGIYDNSTCIGCHSRES